MIIVWTFIAYFNNNHHFSFTEPLVGAVAGLATITPASGYVTPISAIFIGRNYLLYSCITSQQMKFK